MDELLVNIKELKKLAGYSGTLQSFKSSKEILRFCKNNGVIAKGLLPAAMSKNLREEYFQHLVYLAQAFINANPKITSWSDFCSSSSNRSVAKIFFEFGVKAEVFDKIPAKLVPIDSKNDDFRITEDDLYELSKIKFNFKGSKTSFRRMIVDLYGSYAEYCIEKGFDINQTNWEDEETALRCANRLGSIEQIRLKSNSLFKYLHDNGLLEKLGKTS